jgi:hypothetical protein
MCPAGHRGHLENALAFTFHSLPGMGVFASFHSPAPSCHVPITNHPDFVDNPSRAV